MSASTCDVGITDQYVPYKCPEENLIIYFLSISNKRNKMLMKITVKDIVICTF